MLACVTAVVVAVSGAATSVPALRFLPPGHWVFNAALQSVFHVDGATASVDAVAEVPGSAGSLVVQGDTSGYVVGDARITEFGKSSLAVSEGYGAPSAETPVGLEVAGGPYLVYRATGKVVRLGADRRTLNAGGMIGDPVATDDGTVWLPRTGDGLLCRLSPGAGAITCPVRLPKRHSGAMSVLDDKPVFVDTSADTVHPVEADGLGAPRTLGVDVADGARVASTDASGRLVILDQKAHRMHLLDLTGKTEPVVIELPGDDYDGPVANDTVIAVVDRTAGTLDTYGLDGVAREKTPLPQESGAPRITRGEDDRMYVDDPDGEHVLVVDRDGSVAKVPVVMDDEPSATEADEDRQRDDQDTAPPLPQQPPPETQQPPPAEESPPQETADPPQDTDPPAPPPEPEPPEVPASPPGAPAGVQATDGGDASSTVSWGAAPDNMSPITGYAVSWSGGQTTVGGGVLATTVTGLTNGTSYVFTVAATNGVGTGPGASSNSVTPVSPVHPASAPTNLVGSYDFDAQEATLSWSPPADLGGGQLVHYFATAMGIQQQTVTGTSATFGPIQTDGPVSLTVRAVTQTPDGQQLDGETATTTANGARLAPTPIVDLNPRTGEHPAVWRPARLTADARRTAWYSPSALIGVGRNLLTGTCQDWGVDRN